MALTFNRTSREDAGRSQTIDGSPHVCNQAHVNMHDLLICRHKHADYVLRQTARFRQDSAGA